MNEELYEIWEVTWEMMLKDEIEERIKIFYGRQKTIELLNEMEQYVNTIARRIIPEDFTISTNDDTYMLMKLEVNVNINSIAIIDISPVFVGSVNIKLKI